MPRSVSAGMAIGQTRRYQPRADRRRAPEPGSVLVDARRDVEPDVVARERRVGEVGEAVRAHACGAPEVVGPIGRGDRVSLVARERDVAGTLLERPDTGHAEPERAQPGLVEESLAVRVGPARICRGSACSGRTRTQRRAFRSASSSWRGRGGSRGGRDARNPRGAPAAAARHEQRERRNHDDRGEDERIAATHDVRSLRGEPTKLTTAT